MTVSNLPTVAADDSAGKTGLWWLYLLECRDGRTYTGISRDVAARFAVHVRGKGSKFTRANTPVAVLGQLAFATKSAALKAEHALKQLSREQKLAWARDRQREGQ
ncbi:MAG: GIY-YIG nuclease family protein [Pseudohongiellaceae bacterium]|jgi:putative endonuclease